MADRSQRRMLTAALAAALVLAVACTRERIPAAPSPADTVPTTAAAPPTAASPTVSAAAPTAEGGCPPTRMRITLRTADGVDLSAAAVGRGPAGVVLLHESDGTLCNWWAYAWNLAGRGLQVVAVDLRGHGDSKDQESSTAYPRYTQDVLAALDRLRTRGVRRFALVGASVGGTIAMVAAERSPPGAITAVASLSAPTSYGDLAVLPAAARLPPRALYLAAEGDGVFPGYARTFAARTPAGPRALHLVPGSSHGTGLLADHTRDGGTVADLLSAFLTAALH